MTGWSLVYEGFDPKNEMLRETLCTTGNGYFATRGAAPESADDGVHYPGTYLAGGYNRLGTEMSGRVIVNEDLVNVPNWLPLTFRIDGGLWFRLTDVEILHFRQEFNLKEGVLHRDLSFKDADGRTSRLVDRRLVHMAKPHLAALERNLTAEDWSGTVEVRSALDGRLINNGVKRYAQLNQQHLEPVLTCEGGGGVIVLEARTVQSHIHIAEAARTELYVDGVPVPGAAAEIAEEAGYIGTTLKLELGEGATLSVEKVVALYTLRDGTVAECATDAEKTAARAGRFDALLASHRRAWTQLWRRFGTEVEASDPEKTGRLAMLVRLHTLHALQTASPNTADLDAGLPARGWTGEAYRGHVFWDEVYVFPFYTYHMPEITRALLMYRYRRLDEARALARAEGCRGAMYPWQSGSDGREETQVVHLNPKSGRWVPDKSHRQRHVNVAIAYNIWEYFEVTDDIDFLSDYGAEMLLEITRYWASVATYDESRARYEIKSVMGPDEFHTDYPGTAEEAEGGIDNNAYTNVMVAWVMRAALKALDLLSGTRERELWENLEVSEEELKRWRDIERRMYVPFHGDGIISQFDGYEDLEELDWDAYRAKYGDIHRMDRILEAEDDSGNRYKLAKQADTVMLFYLLPQAEVIALFEDSGYGLTPEQILANIDYYEARTSHGSTLSRLVHAWILARHQPERAWTWYKEALESDYVDIQGGTTREGIHMGVMAGTVDLLQRCYTGMEMRDGVLWLDPQLPKAIARLEFPVRFRGHEVVISVTRDALRIIAAQHQEGPVPIGYAGAVHNLAAGETTKFELARSAAICAF